MKKLLLTLFTATALSACVIPITPTVSPQQHAIQGKWGILNLNGKPVTEKDANVGFSLKDQRFYGSGGCNRLNGTYQLDSAKLGITINNITSTRMACANMDTETDLIGALEQVRSYQRQDNTLKLLDGSGNTLSEAEALSQVSGENTPQ